MKIMANVFDVPDTPYDRDPSKNTFAQFLVNKGLYESYELSKESIQNVIDVLNGNVRINIFCKDCGENRTFSLEKVFYPFMLSDDDAEMRSLGKELQQFQRLQVLHETPHPGEKPCKQEWQWTDNRLENYTRVMVFQYRCTFNDQHFTDYIVRASGNSLIKIGQYPSFADLSFPELESYKKILSENDRREFRRAIGLFADGIGVGAYVYLRRIFERILETAKNNALEDGVDLQGYDRAHVDERIRMLKGYLPKALVGNTIFYGIVSKGIHELSEEECKSYFPVLQDFLYLILRQWEQQRQERETEKQISASLSKIASEIKDKNC